MHEPDRYSDPAGHDEINVHGVKEHESYRGDRTQASLTAFADNLVPSAGQPHHYIRCCTCGVRPLLAMLHTLPDDVRQHLIPLITLVGCKQHSRHAELEDPAVTPTVSALPFTAAS